MKRAFGSASSSPIPTESPSCSHPNKQILVSESNAEGIVRTIKYGNLSAEEFDHYWQGCAKFRINQIRKSVSTAEALEKWPNCKQPLGFRLIDMDFKVMHSGAKSLLDNWDEVFQKILHFLSEDRNIKEPRLNGLLNDLKSNKIKETARDAVLLYVMHGFLVPTQKMVVKDKVGKKNTMKFTIKDSQEAFLFIDKTAQQVEDHILHLKQRSESIQPFLIGIGDDLTLVSDFIVYFDGVKFKIKSCIRAVDILFKIFHLFNLEYPIACSNFWGFVQQHLYQIKYSKNNSKISILGSALR